MKTVTIDCAGIRTEEELWAAYLRNTDVDGSHYFGRNLNAFRDALSGGPGWPGEVELQFVNTGHLASLRDGALLEALRQIAEESTSVTVTLA